MRVMTLLLMIGLSTSWHLPAQTFAKDVVPILQQNCQSCHRPGQAAPFSLLTYEQVRPWAKAIKEAVLKKQMPPWFADPRFGHFSNAMVLTEKEIHTLVGWVDAGAPRGDPKDLPAAKQFAEGWTIPKPDIVFQLPKPFFVPAKGVLEYQYVIIPTGFTEDTWVQHVEAAPTNHSLVHHIVAYVRAPGSNYFKEMPKNQFFEAPPSKTTGAAQPKDDVPNDWLAGYAPGQPPDMFEPGQAKLIPAGSDIVLEIHYMPEGKAGTDQSRVGLVLAKEPPRQRAMTLQALNMTFEIPPGDPNFRVDASVHGTRGRHAPRPPSPHAHARKVGAISNPVCRWEERDVARRAELQLALAALVQLCRADTSSKGNQDRVHRALRQFEEQSRKSRSHKDRPLGATEFRRDGSLHVQCRL